jgi:signal transduction histidine kinase
VNALQAMPKGGHLTIALRPVSRGTENLAQVDVRDTGTGIAGEHLGRVFDPFFTTKASGTGLGLSLVRRHVEAHGGEITVATTPGKGSCFTVTLPMNASTT